MKKTIFLLFCISLLAGCKNSNKQNDSSQLKTEMQSGPNDAKILAESTENAHHKDNFTAKKAVQLVLNVHLDGRKDLHATVSFLTDFSKVKLARDDGATLVYDGKKAALFPKSKVYKTAFYDLWTWAYIYSLPFKLTDPGAMWKDKHTDSIKGTAYLAAKMKLKDSNRPQQGWFTVYVDKVTGFLRAASLEKPDGQGSMAVVYNNFFSVNRIPMAKDWLFYDWNGEKGIYGAPIGKATLVKVKFFDPPQGFFEAPADALSIEKEDKNQVL